MLLKDKNSQNYINLVNKYKNGKYDEIIGFCLKNKEINKHPQLLHILGMAKYRKGKHEEAINYINQAIELEPENYKYKLDLGDIYKEKKQFKIALEKYNEVLHLNPKNENAIFKAALTFQLMRIFPSAFRMGVQALALNEKSNKYKLFLAKCLDEMHDFIEAINIYNEILSKDKNCIQALFDKADLSRRMFKYDEALECAKLAYEIDKNNINYYLLMSTIMKDMKRMDEGIEYLNSALIIKPNSQQAHFNKAVMLLGLGDFGNGWDLYEWRWRLKDLEDKIKFTKKPLWDGQKNATLLIWPEQGIGDEVMFSSMFNEINEKVNSVVVKTDPRLLPIFKRSFPNIEFISNTEFVDESLYTHHLPMGSLPKYFRRTRLSFDQNNSKFIKTNDDLNQKLSKYFDCTEKKYIGISWRSVNPVSGLKRSATLKDIINYIGKKDVVYVNLQYGDVKEEISELYKNDKVKVMEIEEIDNKNNIDGLLSIIENCDEVVSIDNSTIHFSGSIGKKTEVLLHESADFRWELYGENANWYKSVKLIRNIIL